MRTLQGTGLFIFARFHAREGNEESLAAALRDEVRLARVDPGCLAHAAFRSTRDPRLFYIHSHWNDEAAFEAHANLPHTVRFVERVQPLIDHELDVSRALRLQEHGGDMKY
jgi:quinol monooxygenase YgiN